MNTAYRSRMCVVCWVKCYFRPTQKYNQIRFNDIAFVLTSSRLNLLQVVALALAVLVANTLAEHDATSYAFYHPKFHHTHHDGHDHYVSVSLLTYCWIIARPVRNTCFVIGRSQNYRLLTNYLLNNVVFEFIRMSIVLFFFLLDLDEPIVSISNYAGRGTTRIIIIWSRNYKRSVSLYSKPTVYTRWPIDAVFPKPRPVS